MSLETVQTDRLLKVSQNESREFITLMTAIFVVSNVLLLILIYQGILRSLQDN